MASRDEINRLRAEVRKRHKAANRKVSRLNSKDVRVSGTEHDPRRDLGKVKKYTAAQMKTYLDELNGFISRGTSFVGGVKSRPLKGDLWGEYKSLEKRYNAITAKGFEEIKDVHLDSLGTTIGGFQAQKPDHPITGNPASRAPHVPVNRSSKGIPNEKQLKKLIKDMKKKLSPDYQQKVIQRDRVTAMKLLKTIGDTELGEGVAGLSDKKFATLWNYTNFARMASFDYLIAKSHLHGNKSLAWQDAQFDTQKRLMKKTIKEISESDKI